MGRFIIGRREDGRALYQYVYGSTYEEFGNNDNISLYIAPLFQVQHTDSITDFYRSVRRFIRTVVPVGLKNAVNITV